MQLKRKGVEREAVTPQLFIETALDAHTQLRERSYQEADADLARYGAFLLKASQDEFDALRTQGILRVGARLNLMIEGLHTNAYAVAALRSFDSLRNRGLPALLPAVLQPSVPRR